MKKQTAVEWLIEQISVKNGYIIFSPSNIDWNGLNEIFDQAKEMDKEQIIDAWLNSLTKGDYNSAEQYYNETFKSE